MPVGKDRRASAADCQGRDVVGRDSLQQVERAAAFQPQSRLVTAIEQDDLVQGRLPGGFLRAEMQRDTVCREPGSLALLQRAQGHAEGAARRSFRPADCSNAPGSSISPRFCQRQPGGAGVQLSVSR